MEKPLALITGGARGIGLAIARRFLIGGWRVALVDRDAAALEAVESEVTPVGGCVITADLCRPEAPGEVLARLGGPEALVHNAGVVFPEPVGGVTEAALEETMGIHVLAGIRLAREYVRVRAGRPGRLVYLASEAAYLGYPNISTYTAAKGALVALARAQAVELAARQVTVNSVSPGITDTPLLRHFLETTSDDPALEIDRLRAMQPGGRLTTPEDVAAAVFFLCGEEAAQITGVDLRCDGAAAIHGHYVSHGPK